MRLFTRSLGLLAVTAALALAASATASATTASISSPGAKAGTTTAAWKLAVQGSSSSATVTCTTAKIYATLGNASGALPLTLSNTYKQTLSGCTTAGTATTVGCTSTAVLKATGLSTNGVTALSLSSLSCTATVSGCGSAKLTGSQPGTYTNGQSQLTLPVTGQSLAVSGSTCSLIPNGTATSSTSTGAALSYLIVPLVAISVY
ncbi:hypothetical protein DSM104299_03031 [Baekduia alba]|uniref:hypothetical protein n=1 Tax=Baekduia alba TaxID=2997333 RepID=UPI00233FF20F|nr:hypothetical protein [Baekduia alba]WCB94299.1 hypothetical protein DSM104299_03031 [Baekduia alba]